MLLEKIKKWFNMVTLTAWFKLFFKLKKTTKQEDTLSNVSGEYDYSKDYISPLNFDNIQAEEIIIPNVEIKNFISDESPTIVIMDDFKGMVDMLYIELLRVQCVDITKHFNIVLAGDKYAAFSVSRYLETHNIDIAFLDITIGGRINNVELDGVDIALQIKKNTIIDNSLSEIRFITGHALNKRVPEMFEFMEKFKEATGLEIDEDERTLIEPTGEELLIKKHIIGKNSNRVLLMALTIERWLKNNGLFEKYCRYNTTEKSEKLGE